MGNKLPKESIADYIQIPWLEEGVSKVTCDEVIGVVIGFVGWPIVGQVCVVVGVGPAAAGVADTRDDNVPTAAVVIVGVAMVMMWKLWEQIKKVVCDVVSVFLQSRASYWPVLLEETAVQ